MADAPDLPGADQVVAWWGGWIGFHDFYLLAVPEAGSGDGELRIHGWVTHPETDERGYFVRSKDCVVRVSLRGIRARELTSDELPAIVFSLRIEPDANGWAVAWDSSYGCEGRIAADRVSLAVEPGLPA
ncbi:MAG: hypothetical protein RL398_1205 [Planctomycetota bacterium]